MDLPMVAGAISTSIFACSMLPMLWKAARTRDLGSYSLGNIGLSNVGNVIHSVYVFTLPPGPVWVLHSFYLVTSALMLFWYLRYAYTGITTRRRATKLRISADAPDSAAPIASASRSAQRSTSGQPGGGDELAADEARAAVRLLAGRGGTR